MEWAFQARLDGNEGLARVCSRRAAIAAVQGYAGAHDIPIKNLKGIHVLEWCAINESIPTTARGNAARLLTRVDEDFTLPSDLDLIIEATQLIRTLEKIPNKDHS